MASKLHDEYLLQSWREEQYTIASQVVVLPEGSSFVALSSTTTISHLSERYDLPSPCSNNDGQTTTKDDEKYLLIGGVDVSFPVAADDEEDANIMGDAVAVYVILKYDKSNYGHSTNSTRSSPEVVYRSHKFYKLTTPYIPSYLAFREIDPIMELITQQRSHKPHLTPNVIMVDGNGQWHDRRAGLACFVGVKSGIPTIGVGKTFYSLDGVMEKSDVVRDVKDSVQNWYHDAYGKQQDDTDESNTVKKRGLIVVNNESIPHDSNEMRVKQHSPPNLIAYEDVLVKLHQVCSGLAIPMRSGKTETVLAYALVGHGGNNPTSNSSCNRKKKKLARGSKNPIYVSCGSHISLLEAVSLVAWTSIARIPEPIREADLYGRQLLRERAN